MRSYGQERTMRNNNGQERTRERSTNQREEERALKRNDEETAPSGEASVRPKAVYNIIEREGQKSIWNRLGTAFTNRDGSLNVVLSAMPFDGKLHIREVAQNDD